MDNCEYHKAYFKEEKNPGSTHVFIFEGNSAQGTTASYMRNLCIKCVRKAYESVLWMLGAAQLNYFWVRVETKNKINLETGENIPPEIWDKIQKGEW